MLAKLIVSPSLEQRVSQIQDLLSEHKLTPNHPDLLYLEDGTKLGTEQTKKIRQYLSLKPYSAKIKVVALESAQDLTPEAQNSLLKTLEEPPGEALILLGVEKEDQLLDTVVSRCEVVSIKGPVSSSKGNKEGFFGDITKLQAFTPQQRFDYVEKLEDKEGFLE